jgi:formylglycine-generating enzyme required for sulfatase activity
MGSPASERYRSSEELQHGVTISKSFYLSETKITVRQFAIFIRDTDYKTDAEVKGYTVSFDLEDSLRAVYRDIRGSWRNPAFSQADDHPVVNISWNDATAFCAWLGKNSNRTVVLPTSAQWEFASRAGATTAYPWGDSPDDGAGCANCFDQTLFHHLKRSPMSILIGMHVRTGFAWNDGFVYTSPVRTFGKNRFGLYDAVGNASEWCQDHYSPIEMKSVVDPTGLSDTDANKVGGAARDRVYRGSSWNDGPSTCRMASYDHAPPNYSSNALGFRVEMRD